MPNAALPLPDSILWDGWWLTKGVPPTSKRPAFRIPEIPDSHAALIAQARRLKKLAERDQSRRSVSAPDRA